LMNNSQVDTISLLSLTNDLMLGSIHNKKSQITYWLQWKLHLYFEKSPIIIYKELFCSHFGVLVVCSGNWYCTNLESFHYVIRVLCHTQTLVNMVLLTCFLLLICSILLWAITYFIRKTTCVHIFKCTCIESLEWMLLILILNIHDG
jgi:hypothetical protein